MSTKLEDLSNELLIKVFQDIQSTASKDDVLSWLLCSRRLHDVAMPLLYRNVSLNFFKTVSFASAFQLDQDKTFLRHTRSLTIWMPAIPPGDIFAGPSDLDKCLRLLARAVKMMTALATFSFVARTNHTWFNRNQRLTVSRIW